MKDLKTVMRKGWPEKKDHVPVAVQDYFSFREELTLQNGFVFKGERLVAPAGAREEIKTRVRASHRNSSLSKESARSIVLPKYEQRN